MLEPRGGTEQREPGAETRGRPRGTKRTRTKWPTSKASSGTDCRACSSEKKTAVVCDQPPGLDELAGHIEAPNMGA